MNYDVRIELRTKKNNYKKYNLKNYYKITDHLKSQLNQFCILSLAKRRKVNIDNKIETTSNFTSNVCVNNNAPSKIIEKIPSSLFFIVNPIC